MDFASAIQTFAEAWVAAKANNNNEKNSINNNMADSEVRVFTFLQDTKQMPIMEIYCLIKYIKIGKEFVL